MGKRHDDALYAQHGACNGLAVSKALMAAYEEAFRETDHTTGANTDPAVRQILHQRAHLAQLHDPYRDYDAWLKDPQTCIGNASKEVLKALRLEDKRTPSQQATRSVNLHTKPGYNPVSR